MNLPEEILTARLRLRPPTEEDAECIFARYGHDLLVCRYMSWTPHQSVDDTRAYLQRIVGENSQANSAGYLILSRETGQLLGSVGGGMQGPRMQFGYCLARDAWGRGYATEAARAFINAAIVDPTIWRIQAFCDTENRASAHVLEKIGMTFEGKLRFLVMPNLGDEPRDMLCYARVKK